MKINEPQDFACWFCGGKKKKIQYFCTPCVKERVDARQLCDFEHPHKNGIKKCWFFNYDEVRKYRKKGE